jgi:hypothetical protein
VKTSASGPSIDHLDLSAFDDSPLLVTVTLGKDHVITYRNKVSRQLASGVDSRSIDLHPARERFADEGAARVRERATEAFVRGVTLTTEDTSVRWQNDDGTWTGGLFSWVLQPLMGASGEVEAILWIGTYRPLPDQWEK